MGIWKEFLDEVCNSDITFSDEFEETISHIAIGRTGNNGALDIGFYGKDSECFANGMIDWIDTNHPLGINQEARDFIHRWRTTDPDRNPRLGINMTRSMGLPHEVYGANTICFGGSMPYDCWWFFDEYDVPGMYANTSQAIEGVGGGIKLYYDLNLERFTTIKAYTRTKNTPSDTLGNRTFSVDNDKNLTLESVQLCYEPEVPQTADDYTGRFETEMDAIFDIKDRYHRPEWSAPDHTGRKSMISMKFAEKIGNANTIPTEVDRGGMIFTLSVFQRDGAELPVPTANTVINNRYRLKPYDSFIE
jgi:hypothetical protein